MRVYFKKNAVAGAWVTGFCLLGLAGSVGSAEDESSASLPGAATGVEASRAQAVPDRLFTPVSEASLSLGAARTKWGGPVIADLDGDGWEDVITTDHGHAAQVFWNEAGTFAEPVVLVRGDTHGLGVADFDRDGRIDVVIARGGGNGGNPRRPVMYTVNPDRTFEAPIEFDFFEKGRGRAVKFLDVDQDADLDLIVTGFAPNRNPNLTTNQLYLNTDGRFEWLTNLPRTVDALSFKALVTDLNNDSDPDLIIYGGRDIKVFQGAPGHDFTDVTQGAVGSIHDLGLISSIVELDYDNDGDMDLFVTRAALQFESERYFDAESGRFAFFVFNTDFQFEDLKIDGDLQLENVQETYAARGVYVGRNRTRVQLDRLDNHAAGRLTITPEQAAGWPAPDPEFNGLQISYLGDGMWRIGGKVRSRLAAVVSKVVSIPETEKRRPLPVKLLENKAGSFVDVTQEMGISIASQTSQATAGDFDNDGWIDLAITRYGNRSRPFNHLVLMNKQGERFARRRNHGLRSKDFGATGKGLLAFDYDQDGQLDVLFGNERGGWHLMRNQADGEARYLKVNVGRAPESHAEPTGARVDVIGCGVTQRRTAGGSEDGFHTSLNAQLHFGMGACEKADRVDVTWPSGERVTITHAAANTTIQAGR